MKAIQVELPEKLAAEIEAYVKTGWFNSEAEVIRAALMDFVRRNRVDLLDRFMRDDIEWALKQKGSIGSQGQRPVEQCGAEGGGRTVTE
jgi:Arc/MetJ-type ribon-helix-helix transcriptional regulator